MVFERLPKLVGFKFACDRFQTVLLHEYESEIHCDSSGYSEFINLCEEKVNKETLRRLQLSIKLLCDRIVRENDGQNVGLFIYRSHLNRIKGCT